MGNLEAKIFESQYKKIINCYLHIVQTPKSNGKQKVCHTGIAIKWKEQQQQKRWLSYCFLNQHWQNHQIRENNYSKYDITVRLEYSSASRTDMSMDFGKVEK